MSDKNRSKEIQAKLLEAEDRFQAIFEHSPDGIVIINPTDHAKGPWLIEYCNQTFCRMNGFNRPELIGKDIRVVSGETATEVAIGNKSHGKLEDGSKGGDAHRREYYRRLKQGPIMIEEVHRRKDGTTFPIQASSCLVTLGGEERVLGIDRDITEQKRAEEALHEGEKRYRQLVDLFPDTLFTLSEGKITFINPAGLKLFGATSADQIIGRQILDLVHPDNRGIVAERLKTLRDEKGSASPVEEKYLSLDGSSIDVEVTAIPFDEHGKPGTQVIVRDISERAHTQEALSNERNLLRSLIDNVPEYIYIKDTQSRFVMANPAVARLFNLATPEELLGETDFHFFPKDLAARYFADEESIFQSGQPLLNHEEPTMDSAGNERWISTTKVPLKDAQGKIFGLVGMGREITERKLTEKALVWERHLFDMLLDNTPDYIYFKDLQSRFIRTTLSLAHAFGLSNPADVIGKTDFDFFTKEHAQAAFEDEQKILRTGEPLVGMIEKETWPNHADTWASTTKMPLRDEEGNIIGTFGISRDITELKRAEDALASQDIELNKKNEELTRLYRFSGSLFSGTFFDVPTLANTIVGVIKEEFSQSHCCVYLVKTDSNELSCLASAGPYTNQAGEITMTLDDPGLVPQAIHTGQATIIPDVLEDPAYMAGWKAARSELTVPLKLGDQVIGAIDVQSAVPNAFTDDDERVLSVFAERAALALEHARLFTQTEHRMQNLLSLRTIDITIASSFDINFTIGVILNQTIKQLGVHAADILICNPTTSTFQYSDGQGFHTQVLRYTSFPFGDGYAGQVARERRMITIQNLDQNLTGLQRPSDFASEGFVTYIGIPLLAKGQVQGVLEVLHREHLELGKEKTDFLKMLAGQAAIAIDNARLFENLQNSTSELTLAYDETIEGWSRAMDLRDQETEGHSLRVTQLTLKLASSLGVDMQEMIYIRRGALLHDIGKIGVPDSILRKPGALTPEEWEIMHKHPQYAYDMLAPILYLKKSIDIPYRHHEKWDGTGYPQGLKGEQIPLAARIFAAADVWDALTSDRPYRKAWTEEKALEYLREQSGKHFDPRVVEVFLEVINRAGI
jgi:PAS domain S-box-containing protein/putative nucleotidyltransferase with HDIG domain